MPQNESRPQLTVCIDVATRMALGHHVSFGSPSIHTALLTLQQINQHSLPCGGRGRPTKVLTDRSFFHSTILHQAMAELDKGARQLDPLS